MVRLAPSGGETLLLEATRWCEAARRASDGSSPSAFDYLAWADACSVPWPHDPIRCVIQTLRAEIAQRVASSAEREPRENGVDACTIALSHMLRDAARGFPALRHPMEFPTSLGFHPASAIQTSDVFGRAIVLEALGVAQARGLVRCAAVLDAGLTHLVRTRSREPAGGWSYFPGLIELAPDIDTLSHVALAFAAHGRTDLLQTYVLPVFARYAEASQDGSLETWLYSADPQLAGLQRWWAQSAWGQGTDTEVVANLAYALRCVASADFPALLECAQRHVVEATEESLRHCAWYHGPYYGVFAATRAVARVPWAQPFLQRCCASLVATQYRDGGWGVGAQSDVLSTALALRSLQYAGTGAQNTHVVRARRYLNERVRDGGLAEATEFIQMNLGRARGDDGPFLSFESSAIRAAFVAMAFMPFGEECNALS
jgi:hypothetical protein